MKKLNNKGFSLVELIIVIAIMAILVGVVGTQVIPYLENSRKAKDLQILSAWNTAAVSAYSTEAGSLDALKEYKIVITNGSAPALDSACSGYKGATKLLDTFKELTNVKSAYNYNNEMSSKAGKNISKVTITINGTNGQVYTHADCNGDYSFDDIENK